MTERLGRRFGGTVAAMLLVACGDDSTAVDGAAPPDAAAVVVDLGVAPIDSGGAGPDAAVPDSGADGGLSVTLPANAAGWTFYGPQAGAPSRVFGAAFDEGGNLWVAGGEEGLFVLRPGEPRFLRFTMRDGLRPYGYMADGTDPPGAKYLKVISVAGAWAGTAFAGYQGMPAGPGEFDCENNWDGPAPDPRIYKSGDADKVTLDGNGIKVVHYDIFSGPGLSAELRGREKLCDILRLAYDPVTKRVWFGGNHGFAMGMADYPGNVDCQWYQTPVAPVPTQHIDPYNNLYGHAACSGVLEHAHPAFNSYYDDGSCCALSTGMYYGVSVEPRTHDVWFAGQFRATRFQYGSTGNDYFAAQSRTEDPPYRSNRIDVWPDAVVEPAIPTAKQRTDDFLSGAAAMPDGSVWVTSFYYGAARIDAGGNVVERIGTGQGLPTDHLSAAAADPLDGSVWLGTNYGPGVIRVGGGGGIRHYAEAALGADLTYEGVTDIQVAGSGAGRKVVVSFAGDGAHAGAIGVYSGP